MTAEPRTLLATHEVTNQPPPIGDVDRFAADPAFAAAVRATAGGHESRIRDFARATGGAAVEEHARRANEHRPVLKSFDRYGRRIDEVEFHPSYHALMALGLEAGVSAGAWTVGAQGHALHAALLFLMSQAEPSVCCPMSMTYAAVPALTRGGAGEVWREGALQPHYDAEMKKAAEKTGLTLGMAMTEKQGGSDVRANATRAAPDGADGAVRLTGHKWFCSAPMSDAFLTLAYEEAGLSCFLVPRVTPDGARNAIHVMRLKDKLGDRANASSEIEYHAAFAERLGEPGRGVRTIIDMVHHTRLDCVIAPAGFMGRTLSEALWHVAHRSAFQKRLIDQPLMRRTLADLTLESDAATALAFRLAEAFDAGYAGDAEAHAFARVATPIAKYWLNKRVVPAVHEAMEAMGGAGYVEESVMPRYYRQAPLNGIWEGSGNVMCLDVLRALAKTPEAAEALLAELATLPGRSSAIDAAVQDVRARLAGGVREGDARAVVERLGVLLQCAALARYDFGDPADYFAARTGADAALSFGAGPVFDEARLDARMDAVTAATTRA